MPNTRDTQLLPLDIVRQLHGLTTSAFVALFTAENLAPCSIARMAQLRFSEGVSMQRLFANTAYPRPFYSVAVATEVQGFSKVSFVGNFLSTAIAFETRPAPTPSSHLRFSFCLWEIRRWFCCLTYDAFEYMQLWMADPADHLIPVLACEIHLLGRAVLITVFTEVFRQFRIGHA